LEALLRNSLVPVTDSAAAEKRNGEYFEFHVKVAMKDQESLDHLGDLCGEFGAHLSRNASNAMSDRTQLRFVTLRVYDKGRDGALLAFRALLDRLSHDGFQLSNVLQEYTILDTNSKLDDGWYKSSRVAFCFEDCSLLAEGDCPHENKALGMARIGIK
jgi:hypothetical protein